MTDKDGAEEVTEDKNPIKGVLFVPYTKDSMLAKELRENEEKLFKVVKNKVAPPFKEVEFDIMYGEGISKMGELLDLGVKAGVVTKSGSWFSYGDERIGQGRENAKTFLRENSTMALEIEDKIRASHGLDFDMAHPGEDGDDILEA